MMLGDVANLANRPVDVAVRGWTERAHNETNSKRSRKTHKRWEPRHAVVFDTETATDFGQTLNFGFARYVRIDGTDVTTLAEILFYADDLPERNPAGYATLKDFAESHDADVDISYPHGKPVPRLMFMPRAEFVYTFIKKLCRTGKRTNPLGPPLIVGFNLPFDLVRIAVEVGEARGQYLGGFLLKLQEDSYSARIRYKTLDSKKALISMAPVERDKRQLDARFLDLRTLAFALTNESYTLAGACEAFGTPTKKLSAGGEHGQITHDYVTYGRQDVKASTELLEKLLREFNRHPINLAVYKAYSPASIAKAYLQGMGVTPILDRHPDFPTDVLGMSMAAFFGGRAECRVRKVNVPVVYTDYTSMYPTVDALMGLWDLLTAKQIHVVDATADVQRLLDTITVEQCLNDPDVWRSFVGIAEVKPDGNILPVRAKYGNGDSWNIGVSHFTSSETLPYSIPDLVASKILTGRTPQIARAIRFVPSDGKLDTLRPIALRGGVTVDPSSQDFFRAVVEQRQLAKRPVHRSTCECEDCRTQRFLKVLANAGCYGIFVELVRKDQAEPETVSVYATHARSWETAIKYPEDPGDYCFPPIGACITGAAKLMLALLENEVTSRGGTYAFTDTDSMAIVATRDGAASGVHIHGSLSNTRILSYQDVKNIVSRFEAVNPYDRDIISGSMLKIEEPSNLNEGPQVWCHAISAKRYHLFSYDSGNIRTVKPSYHGLGVYLNPVDAESPDLDWINQLWRLYLAGVQPNSDDLPEWIDRPALVRVNVSSAHVLRTFRTYNDGKPWSEQIKPANFLVAAKVDPADAAFRVSVLNRCERCGEPLSGSQLKWHSDACRKNAERNGKRTDALRLIAPYEGRSERWVDLPWRNLHSSDNRKYTIHTDRSTPTDIRDRINARIGDNGEERVRAETYRQAMAQYFSLPEYKSADANGMPCGRNTAGLLHRRHVVMAGLVTIGKESNRIEDRQHDLVTNLGEVQNDYGQPEILKTSEAVLDGQVLSVTELKIKTCEVCGGWLSGSQKRFCSEAHRSKVRREERQRREIG